MEGLMLIYVLVLFIIFTFILVPTYLVLSTEIYGDFYFKNIEGRKVLLNSKEKSNVKINYDYVYKNYSNTFRMLKNYFKENDRYYENDLSIYEFPDELTII